MVGHDSHISYEVIEMAVQENRIIILPPHILLDGSRCFQSDGRCKTNISKINFAALFKEEFEKSMGPATIEQKG